MQSMAPCTMPGHDLVVDINFYSSMYGWTIYPVGVCLNGSSKCTYDGARRVISGDGHSQGEITIANEFGTYFLAELEQGGFEWRLFEKWRQNRLRTFIDSNHSSIHRFSDPAMSNQQLFRHVYRGNCKMHHLANVPSTKCINIILKTWYQQNGVTGQCAACINHRVTSNELTLFVFHSLPIWKLVRFGV